MPAKESIKSFLSRLHTLFSMQKTYATKEKQEVTKMSASLCLRTLQKPDKCQHGKKDFCLSYHIQAKQHQRECKGYINLLPVVTFHHPVCLGKQLSGIFHSCAAQHSTALRRTSDALVLSFGNCNTQVLQHVSLLVFTLYV